jgi:hypothetical protein
LGQTNSQQTEAEYMSAQFASALNPFGREAYEQALGIPSGSMLDALPYAEWSEAQQLNALAGQSNQADFAGFEEVGGQIALPAGFPVGEATDAELQALLGPVPVGSDGVRVIALEGGVSVAPSNAELEQAWQGDRYGLSASVGPQDLYTLSSEFGYTNASSMPLGYGFLPQQIDMGVPLSDNYSVRVTGEHRRVGALEGFFTFNGVGQALSGLWDNVTALPDMVESYVYSQIANLYDTQQLYQLATGETDSVDFTNPITSRIQDDGSVLPIMGDTIRGAVMASPLGLIDAGYRGDWRSFGQRLPSVLEVPALARGLGRTALDNTFLGLKATGRVFAPTAGRMAESFLDSQGLILRIVPEGPRSVPKPGDYDFVGPLVGGPVKA